MNFILEKLHKPCLYFSLSFDLVTFYLHDFIPHFCLAGAEQSRLLGAEATTYTIDGLQPDEALVIGVAAVVDQRIGEVVTLSSRTNPHGGSVSGFRVVDVTSQRIRIAWSPSPRATGYKIIWRSDDGKKWLEFILSVLHPNT